MIKLITFDLDNTLWDSDPVILSAEQACWDYLAQHYPKVLNHFDKISLRKLKFELADELPALAHKVSDIRIYCLKQALLRCGYDETNAEQGSLDAFNAFINERQNVTYYPNALDVLTRLSQKYQLAALTNGNANLACLNLSMFEFGLNAEHFDAPKPASYIFDAALAKTGLTAKQVLHVGDHPEHDVYGAHQVGMHTLWFNQHGEAWQRSDCTPDLVVTKLEELPECIASYNRQF
ncbi:HAD family hydrolase [Litoribacillus peritrichatus]|uniref:HAD family hydrolase n=1 Tax=Litoribacillus peritrichatus TaxID=718191 RepID=A0ABP7ND66_9GAMM